VIRKLAEGEKLLNQGHDVAEVCRQLEITESTWHRWRNQYGWVPPSEMQEFRDKWRYYQNLPLRSLDDGAKELYEIALKKAKVARLK